jgi:octaprenyl-diphosphate synthase
VSTLSIATAAEVFDLLREDLAAIEADFARQSASEVEVITDIARYLIAGGGKRIRPLLLLLSAKALGCTSESRIRLGAVVEMLHTATLVHDDIIDEADTRRGRPSSNTTWGNSKCVLAGDWLYMQAFSSALEERNFRVLELLISLTQQMVEGELLQMQKLGHLINEEEYFDLIFRKTACLFKVSMQLGAAITPGHGFGNHEEIEAQLGEYGRNLGLAFQIVDDVLDLTAAEDVLGRWPRTFAKARPRWRSFMLLSAAPARIARLSGRCLPIAASTASLIHRFWRFSTGTGRSTTPWTRPARTPKPPALRLPICPALKPNAPCYGCPASSPPATASYSPSPVS